MQALIIDDSRAIRSIVGDMLRELRYEVLEACHGRDALERLKKNPNINVALVDWNMPEMNGYEFVRAVRADKNYDRMKIVMVTTETEMVKMTQAIQAGAQEYIMKPFTKEVIREKLTMIGMGPE